MKVSDFIRGAEKFIEKYGDVEIRIPTSEVPGKSSERAFALAAIKDDQDKTMFCLVCDVETFEDL